LFEIIKRKRERVFYSWSVNCYSSIKVDIWIWYQNGKLR